VRRRAVVAAVAVLALACRESPSSTPPDAGRARLVSLSPGITDTLYEIGAGADLVARSDYCDHPPQALALPRAGTNLTPNFELLSQLSPTLIFGETGASARAAELGAIATTRLMPWLTVDEVIASTRELGRLTNHAARANELADALHARLSVTPPPNAPRVLLVIGYQPGKLEEIWFIRDNSLHGAALRAAGAKNAVPDAVSGLPRLAPERLIELDPDAIVVLVLPGKGRPGVLDAYRAMKPLRAVRREALAAIEAPEAFVHGPRILALVDRLKAVVEKLPTKDPP